MKNKAPLSLMEQLIMLLVFALSAALCLQVFVLSDKMSLRFDARDNGVMAVQNAAETMKFHQGNLEQCSQAYGGAVADDRWQIDYDEDWNRVSHAEAAYQVFAVPFETEEPLLGGAEVFAQSTDGEYLFGIDVFWQEAAHG